MTLRKFPNLSGPQNQLWKEDNSYTVSEGFEKIKEVKAHKNSKTGLDTFAIPIILFSKFRLLKYSGFAMLG